MINSQDLLSLVVECLARGNLVTLTVSGSSMLPFLRHGKDKVILRQSPYRKVMWGDILLVRRANQKYVLHRLVLKHARGFFLCGDAQKASEGPFDPSQYIARVTMVQRGRHCISCNGFWWKFGSVLWFLVLPFRPLLLKIASYKSPV